MKRRIIQTAAAAALTVCLLLTGCSGPASSEPAADTTQSTTTAASAAQSGTDSASSAAQDPANSTIDGAASVPKNAVLTENTPVGKSLPELLSIPDYSNIQHDTIRSVLATIDRTVEPIILDGRMYYLTAEQQICVLDMFSGATTVLYQHDSNEGRLTHLAVDGQGRVWVLIIMEAVNWVGYVDNGTLNRPQKVLNNLDVNSIACSGNMLFGYYPHSQWVYGQNLLTNEVKMYYLASYKDAAIKYNATKLHQRENAVWWTDVNDHLPYDFETELRTLVFDGTDTYLFLQQGACDTTDLVNAYYSPMAGSVSGDQVVYYASYEDGINIQNCQQYTVPELMSLDLYAIGGRIYYFASDWGIWNAVPATGGDPIYQSPTLADPGAAALMEPYLGVWQHMDSNQTLTITDSALIFTENDKTQVLRYRGTVDKSGFGERELYLVTEVEAGDSLYTYEPAGTELHFLFRIYDGVLSIWYSYPDWNYPSDFPTGYTYTGPA